MKAVPAGFLSLFFLLFASANCFSQQSEKELPLTKTNAIKLDSALYITEIESVKKSNAKKEFLKRHKINPNVPDKFSFIEDSSFTYTYTLKNEEASLGRKLLRGEKMIGGTELLGMGILILLPKKVTKWQDDWMQDAMRNLKRSWTNMPVWDKDDWGFNYLGHPIAGSYYYNAVRSQKASVLSSFAFSAFQSTLWEYVVEGIAERPSIQDLFVTPIGGAILGEVTHRVTLKMQRNGFSFFEKAFVLVLNPMFAINNGFKKKYRRIPIYN